jgi:hypothetical protein
VIDSGHVYRAARRNLDACTCLACNECGGEFVWTLDE